MTGWMFLLSAACSDYGLAGASDDRAPGPSEDTHPRAGLDPGAVCGRGDLDGDVVIDPTCAQWPDAEIDLAPVVEWSWAENPALPGVHRVMSMPVVAHLTDDDHDGVVGGSGDVPDIVFTAYSSSWMASGALVALSGDGSGTLWVVSEVEGQPPHGTGGVAVGDLDLDGSPEVCAAGTDVTVVCVHGDGSPMWARGEAAPRYAAPAIADIDLDGVPEVIVGRSVLTADGSTLWIGEAGSGGVVRSETEAYVASFAMDVDADPELEVIAGASLYDTNGTVLWDVPDAEGFPAVTDFEADGNPDIVVAGGGAVRRLDASDGRLRWGTPIPGGGRGGPPTIVDLDRDGSMDVVVAAASAVVAVRADGSILWEAPVVDVSSSMSSVAAFDLDSDGAIELLVADEENALVIDGATGALRHAFEEHDSATLIESPVIADVDTDGSAEIVFASNGDGSAGWTGITVVGAGGADWAPARPIRNQHAWFEDGVDDQGGIPSPSVPSWRGHRTFRAALPIELVEPIALADLAPEAVDVCVVECAAGRVWVEIAVGNRGLADATATALALVRDDGGVAAAVAVPALSAGESGTVRVGLDVADWGTGRLVAEVDWFLAVDECDESNEVDLGAWPCP